MPFRPRCWPTTLGASGRAVGRLPHGKRAGHADAGRHRRRAAGPDQDVFTTNQIISALAAYRSAADQDTATASSIAAALLSYYTIAQVDGLQARSHGGSLGPANSRALSGRRGGRRGGRRADPGPHGRLTVKLDGSPQQRLQRGLATHTAGAASVDGYTLTLAANPWNIARTYNLTPGRELLFACRHRLGTASNFVAHMSEADNVYDPLCGSFVGDQGAWSTAKMYFTVPPNGVAKLHCAGPAQPDDRNGGRLRPPDPGRNPGGRQHGGGGGHGGLGPAAEAQVPRRRGRRRHAGHPGRGAAGAHAHHIRKFSGALQQPELRGLDQLHGGRLPAGGLRHDPHLHSGVRLGTAVSSSTMLPASRVASRMWRP